MLTPFRKPACVLAVLGITGACTEPTVTTRIPVSAMDTRIADSSASGSTQTSEVPIVSRFALSLAASGSFKPGSPVKLVANVTALIPTAATNVSIQLPEFELAKANHWTLEQIPQRTTIGSVLADHADLAAGSVQRSVIVSIPVPGLYQVILRADAPNEAVRVGGRNVQNMVQRVFWLV